MGLSLKLFVHGVPSGQRSWENSGNARAYIDSFYGRKSDVDTQLIVEIMQEAGVPYCYYTYLKSRNILAADGRPGSYVAMTVRVNAYYADIPNMYMVLDAAYRKILVGTVLAENASSARFLIQDFKQVDDQLSVMESQIVGYISNFSVNADFSSLNGFASNAKTDPLRFNLLDCNASDLLVRMKNTGSIAISPSFPTLRFADIIQRKETELKTLRTSMQQQFLSAEAKAAHDLQAVLREKNDAVNAANAKCIVAANQVKGLENQLKALQDRVLRLEADLKSSQREIGKVNQYKVELKGVKEAIKRREDKIERLNTRLNNARTALNGVPDIDTILGFSGTLQHNNAQRRNDDLAWKVMLCRYSPLVSIILAMALVLVIVLAMMGVFNTQKKPEVKIQGGNIPIEQLGDSLNNTNTKSGQSAVNKNDTGLIKVPE